VGYISTKISILILRVLDISVLSTFLKNQNYNLALFDIHIVDPDTRSYLSHSPGAVASAEAEKKQKHIIKVLLFTEGAFPKSIMVLQQ